MTALSSDNWLAIFMVALFAAVTVIALRRDRKPPALPSCFASDPGPQQRAENCCDDCWCQIPCLMPAPPLDDLLPPHLRMDRVPRVSMFGICSTCRASWHSNDGKCHICRIGYEVEP